MAIVTLTTDLGLRDHFVAALKGQLWSESPDLKIVDVSHDVQPFDLAQAAYFLNNVIDSFPKGTVHFIGVDALPEIRINGGGANRFPLAMQIEGQFFVGCDNGVFSLLRNCENAQKTVRIEAFSSKEALRYPTKHIYIPAVIKLANGENISTLGEAVKEYNQVFTLQPVIGENLIRGSVIHSDKYGNIVVNISENLFNEVGSGHPFAIYLRSHNYFIERISQNYNEVPPGEKLALFNENGMLEIAINKGVQSNGGGAGSLLGIKVGDVIRIEFQPPGSKENIESLFQRS